MPVRVIRLALLLALLLPRDSLAAEPGIPPKPAARPPSVVFFFIDTLRADHVHCLGYDRPTTPQLDDLARRGTLFAQAIAQANESHSSYATVFTSLYPPSHGVLDGALALNPRLQTLAGILQKHGYRTGGFVGGGQLPPESGLGNGFERYWSTPHPGSLMRTVPEALRWLNEQPAGDPFFLFVQGYDAHGPYSPPLGFGELYDPGYSGIVHQPGFLTLQVLQRVTGNTLGPQVLLEYERTPFGSPGHSGRRRTLLPPALPGATVASPPTGSTTLSTPRWRFDGTPGPAGLPARLPAVRTCLTTADVAHLVAHYDGAITYADMWLGIFLDSLRARRRLENTVVVVAGDHGESLGEHGRFGHGFAMYESILHVPLVVSGPGVASHRVVTDVVGLVDLAPTVLELAGIPPLHTHQGRSLAPYLASTAPPPCDPGRVAFSYGADRYSIRTARHHLFFTLLPRTGRTYDLRLHDLVADPDEHRNLAAEEPALVEQLFSRVKDWQEQTVPTELAVPSGLNPSLKQRLRLFGYW
jgi:arylsulfatase A-like enzyme